MFKDKALYVQMVRKDQPIAATQATPGSSTSPEWINEAIKEQVTHVAVTVAAVMAVSTFLKTLSEIAIIKSSRKK